MVLLTRSKLPGKMQNVHIPLSEYSGMSASDWGRSCAARLGEAGGIVGSCYTSTELLAIMGIKGTISVGAKVLHSTRATKVVSAAYSAF